MKLWDVSLATGKLDSEVKARIIGIQNQMCKFEFFYGLKLSDVVSLTLFLLIWVDKYFEIC